MSAPPLLSPDVRASLPLAARFSVYTLLIAALSIMLPAVVRQQGVAFFYENGALEWCQFSLLGICVLLFAGGALCKRPAKHVYRICSG